MPRRHLRRQSGPRSAPHARQDLQPYQGTDRRSGRIPSFPVMPLALETAVRVEQAVYDCVYLALAVTNQCQMVTADERFYNALQSDALATHLCWVTGVP